MSGSKRREFYYQANANAFGGRLAQPFEQVLPVLAPTSLPSAGGYASARHEGFHVEEIISIANLHTQVAGSRSASGSFTTLVTSVVEGLNVNNILFADRIVAQISTSFSERSPFPKVSFLGTAFEGLRIGNLELRPLFNLGLLDGGEQGKYPTVSYLDDRDFHERVGAQTSRFSEFLEGLPREEQAHHEWAQDYANADTNTHEEILRRGNVLCSLIDGFEATETSVPGTQIGHAIHIPDFGRIFLAELIAGHHSFDLTMLRLELGCPVSGTASAAQASSSGSQVAPRGSGGAGHSPGAISTGISGTLQTLQGVGDATTQAKMTPDAAAATPPSGTAPIAPRGSGGAGHS